jgi:hypothetical protein
MSRSEAERIVAIRADPRRLSGIVAVRKLLT